MSDERDRTRRELPFVFTIISLLLMCGVSIALQCSNNMVVYVEICLIRVMLLNLLMNASERLHSNSKLGESVSRFPQNNYSAVADCVVLV